jgi:hypothetical protein
VTVVVSGRRRPFFFFPLRLCGSFFCLAFADGLLYAALDAGGTIMANWRQLAMSALLADGGIDDREVAILRKEFFADRRIDRAEMEFLLEARRKAKSCVPSYEKLIFEALRSCILADDSISPEETEWIRQFILADGKVDAAEKHWLKELKCLAGRVCPEFQALYDQYVGK